MIILISMCIF